MLANKEPELQLDKGDAVNNEVWILNEMYLDEVDEDSTDFAYAGDFVCWRSGRTCDKLLIYNVITQEEKEFLLDNFSIPVNDQN